MLDQAFEALSKYDWGQDPNVLQPIDQAVVSSQKDEAARKDLEKKLVAVLKTDASRDAKDYVCRKLMVIGTADSTPALAELLTDEKLAHMGRYALERIPAPEAGQVLRNALAKTSGPLKVGVISSLGVRRDTDSISDLAALVSDSDASIACAAAYALGDIRSADAAKALKGAKPANDAKLATADATFACAESLLADGNKLEALALSKSLASDSQPKHIRLAATRGMLACAGKKEA